MQLKNNKNGWTQDLGQFLQEQFMQNSTEFAIIDPWDDSTKCGILWRLAIARNPQDVLYLLTITGCISSFSFPRGSVMLGKEF